MASADDQQPPPSAKEVFVETDPGIGEFTYRWPRAGLTVDVVLVAAPGVAPDAKGSSSCSSSATLLLIERKRPPGQDRWALAGGFVNEGEPLGEAAARELSEETGVEVVAVDAADAEEEEEGAKGSGSVTIDQLRAYGDPGRDPRGWSVTIAFAGVVRDDPQGKNRAALAATAGGDDASDARWFPLSAPLPPLAFDHKMIVRDALRKLVREEEERRGKGKGDEELLRDLKAALRSEALQGGWDRAF